MTDRLEEALQALHEADRRAYHSATPTSIREPILKARQALEAYLRGTDSNHE